MNPSDRAALRAGTLSAVVAICLSGTTRVAAQDVAAGEALYQSVCKNCHGPEAQGMASFPKLAGHDTGFLVRRLEQYRAGEKVGPNSPLMVPMAANLSDEDIADLVAYITNTFE